MEKLKGRPEKASADTRLSDLGISYDQSSKWQKLAGIPEDDFEASLAAPGKPSTTGIIAEHAAPSRSPVLPNALWLRGRLSRDIRPGPHARGAGQGRRPHRLRGEGERLAAARAGGRRDPRVGNEGAARPS